MGLAGFPFFLGTWNRLGNEVLATVHGTVRFASDEDWGKVGPGKPEFA